MFTFDEWKYGGPGGGGGGEGTCVLRGVHTFVIKIKKYP